MQPVPVLEYAPTAPPAYAVWLRRVVALGIILAAGLVCAVVGYLLEPPTYTAAAYVVVNPAPRESAAAMQANAQNGLRDLQRNLAALDDKAPTRVIPIPESHLIAVSLTDRNAVRARDLVNRAVTTTTTTFPAIGVASLATVPTQGHRTHLNAFAGLLLGAGVAPFFVFRRSLLATRQRATQGRGHVHDA